MEKIYKFLIICLIVITMITLKKINKKETIEKFKKKNSKKISKKKCSKLKRKWRNNKCSQICKKGDEILYKNKCFPVKKMKIVKMDEIQMDENKLHGFVGGYDGDRKYFYEYEYKNEIVYLKFLKINGTKFKQIGNDIIIRDVDFYPEKEIRKNLFFFSGRENCNFNNYCFIQFGFDLRGNKLFIWRKDKNNKNFYLNLYKLKNNKWVKKISNFMILDYQYLESEKILFKNYFDEHEAFRNPYLHLLFTNVYTERNLFSSPKRNINLFHFSEGLSRKTIINSGRIINFTDIGKTKSFKYKNGKLVELEIPINKNYRSLKSWLFKNGKIMVISVIDFDKLYENDDKKKNAALPQLSLLLYKLDKNNDKWIFIDKKFIHHLNHLRSNFPALIMYTSRISVFMKKSYIYYYLQFNENKQYIFTKNKLYTSNMNPYKISYKNFMVSTKIFKLKEDKQIEINNYNKFKSFISKIHFDEIDDNDNDKIYQLKTFETYFLSNGLFLKHYIIKTNNKYKAFYKFYKINKYKLEFIDRIIIDVFNWLIFRVIKNKIYFYDQNSKKLFYYKIKKCKKGDNNCKNIIPDKCKNKIEKDPNCPIEFPYGKDLTCYNKQYCDVDMDCLDYDDKHFGCRKKEYCEVNEFSKEFNKHIKEKGECLKDCYGTFIANDKCGLNKGCCIKKQEINKSCEINKYDTILEENISGKGECGSYDSCKGKAVYDSNCEKAFGKSEAHCCIDQKM